MDLQTALLDRLNTWRLQLPLTDNAQWPPALRQLIHSQDSIGWKNFLEGLPSTLWSQYLQHHYTTHGYSHTGPQWTYKVLKKLHFMAWSLWEHRNKTLHDEQGQHQQHAIHLLNETIRSEYARGMDGLPASCQHFFRKSLLTLLSKRTSTKQDWLLGLHAARDRESRRRNIAVESRAKAPVYVWIKTRKLPSSHLNPPHT